MESLSVAQHIFGKEKSCSALYIANGRTPIFRTYLRVVLRILREEEMPPNNSLRWHTIGLTLPNSLKFTTLPNALQACMHTPYKHSRHELLIAFYTWGLDLIGLIHPPLNECIQIFAALSNSLSGWKQFHSIKATAMVITKLIKKHLIRRFDISLISNNNTSPLCQFLEASPIKC